jgi:hypothetical protein
MTTRYAAFSSNMLHSPFPFGIQALRQGLVGCTRDIPILPAAFAALIFADDTAQSSHTHFALTPRSIDDLLVRSLWPQHATLPFSFRNFSHMARISWVCTRLSNSPDILRYTPFLPLKRRTSSLRIPWACGGSWRAGRAETCKSRFGGERLALLGN